MHALTEAGRRTLFSIRLAALLAVLLAGCRMPLPGQAPVPVPPPPPAAARDTTPRPIVDTEETIWPDPRERTSGRLESLRLLLGRYVREHGSLPATLEDFAPSLEVAPRDLSRDGWGRKFLYTLAGAEYEVRSVGGDGLEGTADDLVVTRDRSAPLRGSALPRVVVSAALQAMRASPGDTTEFHVTEGFFDAEAWVVTVLATDMRRGGGAQVRVKEDGHVEILTRFQ